MNNARVRVLDRFSRPSAALCLLAAAACIGALGCEGEYEPEPHGGGYVADPAPEPTDPAGNGGARSALGKAKESAERVINEDIAEYNRKLEEAADGKFE
jgi:hypothetical protein